MHCLKVSAILVLLLVFYLSLYVSGFFKLICPRIKRKNENIGFHLEVKGETLPQQQNIFQELESKLREFSEFVFFYKALCIGCSALVIEQDGEEALAAASHHRMGTQFRNNWLCSSITSPGSWGLAR